MQVRHSLSSLTMAFTDKAPVSPEMMVILMHQEAPLRFLEKLAANIPAFQVFEACADNRIDCHHGAVILNLGYRGRMSWLGRVIDSVRWWS